MTVGETKYFCAKGQFDSTWTVRMICIAPGFKMNKHSNLTIHAEILTGYTPG